MSPARDDLTPIGRTDSATTFDSPFSAVLLAVWDWESLFLPASGQGGRNLMAFQGILCFVLPCFAGGSRSPPSPASIFLAGDFLYTKFCVQTRVKPPPLAFPRGLG